MRVMLDVYSGVPNPIWELSADKAKELVDRLAGKAIDPRAEAPNVLGFRGYVIMSEGDDQLARAGLPSDFRINLLAPLAGFSLDEDGKEAPPAPLSAESEDTALWLLRTARGVVDDELAQFVERSIRSSPDTGPGGDPGDKAACVIQNTPYNPSFWNQPGTQPYNNCYNYAMNYRSNTFAQPGRISGHLYSSLTCPSVGTAADWDGCKTVCSGSNKNVALVIWPGRDYHWYRRHSEGFWGHKPGSTAARNTDNSGNVIFNPQTCNRGPYTQFCGYRFSPTGMKVS
ncbi:hypothetical protein [Archangium primigenium]|uniref:hypothetical protein n=1 Tax=[Archangium] primigenium TaxID=2792470 RepID=UPI001959E604|nr:hypothetical protein [Archangium primigenium]MBM7115388.1 hypothetical protein [Archangium primigenium]